MATITIIAIPLGSGTAKAKPERSATDGLHQATIS